MTENNEKKTKMVSENKVKIKLMRVALVEGQQKPAGTVCEVSEQEAQQLCAPKKGPYTHSGFRPTSQASYANLAKAVRL